MPTMPTLTRNRPATADAPKPMDKEDSKDSKRNAKYDVPFDDTGILKYGEAGSEVLKKAAAEIRFVDTTIRALVQRMGDMMYRAHGVGLAAPQIGESIRLLVYDAGDGLRPLINPLIVKSKGEQFEPEEGCLSIPGLRGVVRRANDITVRALDGAGRPIRFRATEFEARVIQHEIDHLDGILFIDRADASTLHMLTQEEKAEEEREIRADAAGTSDIPPAE